MAFGAGITSSSLNRTHTLNGNCTCTMLVATSLMCTNVFVSKHSNLGFFKCNKPFTNSLPHLRECHRLCFGVVVVEFLQK